MSNDQSEGGDMLSAIHPVVSVIMANYNGSAYLGEALESVLGQTLADIEIIVADDASTDDSLSVVEAFMGTDARVRLAPSAINNGPANARNRGLDMARGDWIAIVDADDVIAPGRLARLIELADTSNTDIVADDLLYFVDGAEPHARLLQSANFSSPELVTPELFVAGKTQAGHPVAFGYLKPLIRRSALAGIRYDETLQIGEDYDLLLRLLLAGADLRVTPEAMYHYRRHDKSTSHRLSVATVRAMIDSQDRFVVGNAPLSPSIAAAFQRRRDALSGRLAYEELVEAIKGRRLGSVLGTLLEQPGLLIRLGRSAGEGLTRRFAARSGKVAG